jgi:hypothetical protein
VLARFAHRMLNDDPFFRCACRLPRTSARSSTSSREIAAIGARLVRVRVEETRCNAFCLESLMRVDERRPDPIEHPFQMLKEIGETRQAAFAGTPSCVARAMRFFTGLRPSSRS